LIPALRPCVFFDRDGVVNADPHPARYVTSPEAFYLFPGFVRALRVVRDKGWMAVLITNQKGVATGVIPPGMLERIHGHMADLLMSEGLAFDAIYACTHTEADACDCRKPKPGSILRAAREQGVDLANSWMIGDSPRDMEAGRAAGCHTLMVGPKTGGEAEVRLPEIDDLAGWLDAHLAPQCPDSPAHRRPPPPQSV